MACGCPVVGASTGALPEVVQGAAVLVDPKSDVEMKEAILKVISEPNFSQQLVKKSLSRAKDFTWRKCAAETLEAFNEFV